MPESKSRLLIMLLLLLVIPLWTRAQVGTARTGNTPVVRQDPRVEKALVSLDLAYTLVPAGGFGVRYRFTDQGRGQEIYIASATDSYDHLEMREVWSRTMSVRGQIPAAAANRALLATKKFGGWRVYKTSAGESVLYFSAQIAANADARTLKSVIELVGTVADQMEAELTGKDEF